MMKSKKKLGLIILLVGIALFIFAKNHNYGNTINVKTSSYDTPVGGTATLEIKGKKDGETLYKVGEIVGIVLMVFGAGMFFFNRKKT